MKRASLSIFLAVVLASCTAQPGVDRVVVSPAPADNAALDLSLPEILRAEPMQGGWLIGRASPDVKRILYDGDAIVPADDGTFFVAFDRDADTNAMLAVEYRGGTTRMLPFELEQGRWALQNVNVPYRGSARSDQEFERLRAGELEQIVAARTLATDADGWRQRFVWPVEGRISGRFGAQRIYQGKPGPYHGGLDIAVPTGTPFVAPADGTVVLATASPFTLEGYLLIIDHGEGLNSAFLHCSEILVREGQTVRQGELVGKVGATGRATGPHLHWGLKWRDARIDPLLLLERPDLQAGA